MNKLIEFTSGGFTLMLFAAFLIHQVPVAMEVETNMRQQQVADNQHRVELITHCNNNPNDMECE